MHNVHGDLDEVIGTNRRDLSMPDWGVIPILDCANSSTPEEVSLMENSLLSLTLRHGGKQAETGALNRFPEDGRIATMISAPVSSVPADFPRAE
jgi:hypothetical protein